MQTDRRDRLRRLLIRSTELEIAVGIHWPELWGGLAALWATIGSLGMFPPLFLPTTPLTVYTEYTGIVIQTRTCRAVGYWSSLPPEYHVLPTSPSPAVARPYTSLLVLLWPEVHPSWSTSDFYLAVSRGVRPEWYRDSLREATGIRSILRTILRRRNVRHCIERNRNARNDFLDIGEPRSWNGKIYIYISVTSVSNRNEKWFLLMLSVISRVVWTL